MIQRHLAHTLTEAARHYPVVTLTGPRQSGKTTLVRATFPAHDYASLEDPDARAFALEDPRGFLNRFQGPVILDEVQRVPGLFSYIQGIVDSRDLPGQFILTGSQNFQLLQGISQSLAGRCSILHLLPFSRSELLGRAPLTPEEVGRTAPPPNTQASGRLHEVLFKGFYPRIHDRGLPPQDWLGNYVQTYLERDVRDLAHVGDLETFHRFLRLCAGRSGQLLNLSALGADCGVSHSTAGRWLSVLETSFLVLLLRPFHASFNKRLVKSPKLYFTDPGLLCFLLRIRSPEDLETHAARGAVFESFVVSEMLKVQYHRGAPSDLYFWRDASGHEIDLLLDLGRVQTVVEIKSGQTVAGDFFKGLEFWRGLPGQAEAPAALVYGGEESYIRKGSHVYSWKAWG